MTPERVRELAEQAGCHAGCDRDNHHLRYAIRQAVNEALEEIVALVEEHARQYAPVNAALLEQARRSIRALKLPEE